MTIHDMTKGTRLLKADSSGAADTIIAETARIHKLTVIVFTFRNLQAVAMHCGQRTPAIVIPTLYC